MKKLSVLLLIAVAACGGKKSSKLVTDAVASVTALKTKMCACKDPACVMPLLLEYKKWGEGLMAAKKGDTAITADDEKLLDSLTTELQNCADKAMPDDKPATGKPEPTEKAEHKADEPAPSGPKSTEATLQLNKLGKNSKTYFITQAEFVKGTAATLPDGDCCKNPGGTCAVSDAWAKDPVWQALDFQIDEPSRFHYSYEGDGKTFKATAVGDPACDGKTVTVTVEGSAPTGNPELKITGP